jgi:hypothetical protein
LNGGNQSFNFRSFRNIGLDGQATPAEFFNLIGQRICFFPGDPEINRHVCAGGGQRKCYGSPNATTGTGNQGDFADKVGGLHGSKNTLDLANSSNKGGEIPIVEDPCRTGLFFVLLSISGNWQPLPQGRHHPDQSLRKSKESINESKRSDNRWNGRPDGGRRDHPYGRSSSSRGR